MTITRRGLATLGAGLGLAATSTPAPAQTANWRDIAALYDKPEGVIQLENGNWGAMMRPTLAAFEEHTRRVNRDTSYYARRSFNADLEAARAKAAETLGVMPEELAFTRGATEALQALIGGYNKLAPGDAVLISDTDYDSMQTAMRWLVQRRGVEIVEIALPDNASKAAIIETYEQAFLANPKLKLVLLTHVSHRHGLRLPVAEIADAARAKGADVILDAAHAWGQMAFNLPGLKADFVGLNAHKWIGAPIGVGLIYIAKDRIADIDPFMGEPGAPGDIRSRIHTGTANFAAYLALPTALDLHQRIGAHAIEARLNALRARWTERLRGRHGIDVLTPTAPALGSAIAAFRLTGKTGARENFELARTLLDQHRIFTVARTGLASGACVRVTPALHTSEDEIDAFLRAVESRA